VGLVIALPFFVLLARGHIRVEHQLRLANLPLLVAAQGALGWYMVQSGLSGRTSVSPYRLVAHLGLALVIFLIAVWTALDLRSSSRAGERRALVVAGLAVLTILSGGFVAGLDAGHIYNTFPLMGAGVVPPGYWQLDPWWRNLFENPAAAQFNHRVLATATAVTTWLSWWRQRHDVTGGDRWHVVATVAALQFGLGIGTLLLAVPIPLAALHQLGAVALLTAALWASRGRGAG
jgi:cytochrome c oxidase assembly protein subunit 15